MAVVSQCHEQRQGSGLGDEYWSGRKAPSDDPIGVRLPSVPKRNSSWEGDVIQNGLCRITADGLMNRTIVDILT